MHATTIGVDLAKTRIQLAVADEHHQVQQRLRLSRTRFEAFVANHPKCLFVMEACGSSQPWGRKLKSMGHDVKLLPAQSAGQRSRGRDDVPITGRGPAIAGRPPGTPRLPAAVCGLRIRDLRRAP